MAQGAPALAVFAPKVVNWALLRPTPFLTLNCPTFMLYLYG